VEKCGICQLVTDYIHPISHSKKGVTIIMKKKLFLILLPVFLGLFITTILVVIPAMASPQPNLIALGDDEIHIYGTIESFPDQLLGEWIVSGVSYTADSSTIFREEHGSFAIGTCVGVNYIEDVPGGGYRALKIETEHNYKCESSPDPLIEASGVVVSFPEDLVGTWVIGTTTYTATTNTRFEQEQGPFFVGVCVEVKYVSSTFEAVEIATTETEECGEEGEEHFFGLIEVVPEAYTATITSTWVISGVEFISTPETEFETEHGPLVVGACAKVEYQVVDGQNMANEIKSEWAYQCLGSIGFNQIYGSVVSFPPDLYGTWVISPTSDTTFMFMTDPSTRFNDRNHDFNIGTCIEVKYYTQDGVNRAVDVRIKEGHHCELIEIPSLSKIIAIIEMRPPTDTLTGTWTFAGVSFTATEATHFEEDSGDLVVGDCVEAKYDPASGAMLLNQLEGEDADECQAEDGSELFKLFGVVETMPDGGVFTGTWEVSGVVIEAISTTVFEQDHGALAPGAYVEVKFTYDVGTGVRTATKIATHVAPGFGRIHEFGHLESIQPGGAPDGSDLWIIDGISYLEDPAIDASLNLTIGSIVYVNAYEVSGNLYATRIVAATIIYLPFAKR
jgi:hypothetical protein